VSASVTRGKGDAVLLAQLLSGSTVKDAATAAGLSERQARRRLARPDLRAELDRWRREVVAGVVAALADLADEALDAQRELLADAPPAVRRQVARDVLDALRELGQGADLDARIAEIEAKLGLDELGRRRPAA
jgi:hypothetical protein